MGRRTALDDAGGRAAYEELLGRDPQALANAAADPDRPRYHFLPPPAWMNDPIPFFAQGRYHVFFQYNPGRPYWGDMHWGHAVSDDLVHWETLPVALAPTPGGPDAEGCFTGCVVADGDRYHALYTGVDPQTQCLATSTDLVRWTKTPGAVLGQDQKPAGLGETFRDPCVWAEDGLWYMVLGAITPAGQGSPLLYHSPDLQRWTYLHPLYAGPAARDECPDLFGLDGRQVLLSSRDATGWAVGTWRERRFVPETSGTLDAGVLYAAKTLGDEHGRRIAWGWIREDRPTAAQIQAGWSGALSLPRLLRILPDGTLGCSPVPELSALRGECLAPAVALAGTSPEAPARIAGPEGGCFELAVRFTKGPAAVCGLVIPGWGPLAFGPPGAGPGVISLPGEPAKALTLRVFVDRSVVEVFANDRIGMTVRAYRARGGSAGWIGVFADGPHGPEADIQLWDIPTAGVGA